MTETYVIDGYNVLYRLSDFFSKSLTREQLLDFLIQFRPQGRNRAVVVFDGYGTNNFLSGNIQIVYSKSYSADDYILHLLKTNRYKYVMVVSDDRELRARAKMLGAKVVASSDFLKIGLKRKTSTIKRNAGKTEKPSLLSVEAFRIKRELEKVWLKKK